MRQIQKVAQGYGPAVVLRLELIPAVVEQASVV